MGKWGLGEWCGRMWIGGWGLGGWDGKMGLEYGDCENGKCEDGKGGWVWKDGDCDEGDW